MSAFICTPEHIATLVAWHAANGYPGERFDSEHAAETLMRANIASVSHSYPTVALADRPGPDGADEELIEETKRLATDLAFSRGARQRKPVEIIKLAQSLEYQSCEPSDWMTTPAKTLIDAIIFRAATRLDGYLAASWSI